MSISPVSPLLLQRYELKYLITPDMVEPISKFIEGHCVMDYYSQIAPQNSYVINSLYFDTFTKQLLRRKLEGLDNTYCLRVRSYGSEPKPPYFTEVKLKKNDFSNKMRAKVDVENWAEMLESGTVPDDFDPKSRQYLEQFIFLMHKDGARPAILTQYRRKAYLSEIDGYARVTFDRDLRYQIEENYNVHPDESLMCHYDVDEIYPHPDKNVILELKCEKKIPLWMKQLIMKFDLTRKGFSKYGTSIFEILSPKAPEFPRFDDRQPKFNHPGLFTP
jgi:SPX domain protein involved in polyphosphate accumulation